MDDQNGFKQNLMAAGELYGKEVSPQLAKLYWRALDEYSDEQIQAAFYLALKTFKFMPKPSEIRELIDGSKNENAIGSWAQVMEEIRKTGSYGEPRLPDGIKEVIQQIGGWKTICALDLKSLEFKSRTFCEIYEGKAERGTLAIGNGIKLLN